MTSNTTAFQQLPQLLGGILTLDVDTYAALHTLPRIAPLAWLIVLIAGLSEALGHSVILFVNRVKPRRFIPALLSVALSWSLGFILLFLSTWGITVWVFDQDLSWAIFIRTLSFASLPLCALVFTAMPYFGTPIYVLLTFYSLLCTVTGLEAITTLNTSQALACAAFGWVALQLLQRTLGRPMVALGKQLERRASGTVFRSDRLNLTELIGEGIEELQALLEGEADDLRRP